MRIGFLLLLFVCLSFGQLGAVYAQSSCSEAILRDAPAVSIKGAQFLLQRKQPDHTAPQVRRAADIVKKTQQKTLVKPVEKIQAWLERTDRWLHDYQGSSRAQAMLLTLFYKAYVIKKSEIPESFYDLEIRIAREKGRGDLVLSQDKKDYMAEVAIADQKESLKIWVDQLFFSKDFESVPTWVKIWCFSGLAKLGPFNPETGLFANRTKGQTAPFPTLDFKALQTTLNALNAQVEGKSLNITDPQLQQQLQTTNFGKIYGRALWLEINQRLETLEVKGQWVKYDQASDPMPMVESLKCKNTGWCIAFPDTAMKKLADGDMYIYYSLNEKNQATEPRIAIRMDGSIIGEVRGVGPDQALDPKIVKASVLEDKLKDFGPEGSLYLKRFSDMKRLTLIEQKHLKDIPLTAEELRFLYEIDGRIEGFGQHTDPRIVALKSSRDTRQDLAIALNVSEEEISLTAEEAVMGNKAYHYGDLHLNSLQTAEGIVLPKYIRGSLVLPRLDSAKNLTLPITVEGSLFMPLVKSLKGVNLPKTVSGTLFLKGLSSTVGLQLPETLGGLSMESLVSARGLKLPSNFNGSLLLNGLRSAKGLVLPEFIGGDLSLGVLSTEGLELPKTITGSLRLQKLQSAQGLTLPKKFGGLYLEALESASGLTLPTVLDGTLYLRGIKTTQDLKLPDTIHGDLFLNNLASALGLKLPAVVDEGLYLEALQSEKNLVLPTQVKLVWLKGLMWSEKLKLPTKFNAVLFKDQTIKP